MIFAIDFDGTIVEDDYPKIGKLKDGAKETINSLYDKGHHIIIWTCRSGIKQSVAEVFLKKNGVKYHTINNSLPHHIAKFNYLDPRKVGADVYIDDKHLGFKVDWKKINKEIKKITEPIPYWKQIEYWFLKSIKQYGIIGSTNRSSRNLLCFKFLESCKFSKVFVEFFISLEEIFVFF